MGPPSMQPDELAAVEGVPAVQVLPALQGELRTASKVRWVLVDERPPPRHHPLLHTQHSNGHLVEDQAAAEHLLQALVQLQSQSPEEQLSEEQQELLLL